MDLFPGPHSQKKNKGFMQHAIRPPTANNNNKVQQAGSSSGNGNNNSAASEEFNLSVNANTDAIAGDNNNGTSSSEADEMSDKLQNITIDEVHKTVKREIGMLEHSYTPTAVECVFRFKRDVAKNSNSTEDEDELFDDYDGMELCDEDMIRERLLNDSDTNQYSFLPTQEYHARPGDKNGGGVANGGGKPTDVRLATSLGANGGRGNSTKGIQCQISSRPFIMYYLILLFLLCFATPVLITTSLNVFIQVRSKRTTFLRRVFFQL